MTEFIDTFSSYNNRYYQAATGIASQQWLLTQVRSAASNYVGNVTVTEVTHSFSPQSSIVARITGSDPTLRSEVVIIGAHQDSINIRGSSLAAPGKNKSKIHAYFFYKKN
jgi:leucyl aminopeptidase